MQAPAEPRKTILVVEDEGLIADDIRRRLERLGYSVPATASSGEEALQLAQSQTFDLVLMDIRLKGEMDGIATAQQLRAGLRAPVVYLTAHADPDTVGRAALTEPFGYILKPIADGNLRSTVQIALYKAEMERRLRAGEAWLSTTLRSIGDGLIATSTDGDIVFLNSAAARLTGWTPSDAAGRPLMDVLTLRDESSGEPSRNPVFDLFRDETRAYQLVPRSGAPIPIEAECFENRDNSELLGAILVLRDVRERREWNERLIQSQRMDAVAALAGGVAGDFDALLGAVRGQIDDLYPRLAGEERDLVGAIRQSVSRAATLTGHLSALSRLAPPCREAIAVNHAIRESTGALSRCLGSGFALVLDLPGGSGFIQGDPNRFQQVLAHLALHARETMSAGGKLRVETATLDYDAADPAARRYGGQWFVRLRFAWPCPDLDEGALPAIFEPRPGRFSLAIAHAIVAEGGGRIRACREAADVLCFEILWPCIGVHHGVEGLVGRSHLREPVPTILLVEEEDAVRRAMSRCLEEDGYQVLEFRNAADAELAAASYREPIALLVVDTASAPLAGRLKIPATLCLSGYRHDGLPDPSVLCKPFPIDEFLRRVRARV